MDYFVVSVAGFLLGGWAIPLGFVLGLGPVPTFIASTVGGLIGLWAFLLAGDQITKLAQRARGDATASTTDRIAADSAEGSEESDRAGAGGKRVGEFVDRYGVRGLGLVGPVFPGVTVSVVGGLALGLDRRELGRWMTIGIIVLYGLYALGLSLLVSLF